MSSILENLGSITTGGNYVYFEDGVYRLRVAEIRHTKDGFKGESVGVEFIVMKATPTTPGVTPNQPGTRVGTAWNVTKHKDSAARNIKSFLLGVVGSLGIQEVEFNTLNQLSSQEQRAKGIEVDVEAFHKPGKKYTSFRWSVIPQTPEQIKAQRAEMAAGTMQFGAPVVATPASSERQAPPPAETPAPQGDQSVAGMLAGLGIK